MWTYRVVKERVSGGTDRYSICEVYGGGYTDPVPVAAFSDDDADPIESLRWQLTHMLDALDKPIYEPPSDKADDPPGHMR